MTARQHLLTLVLTSFALFACSVAVQAQSFGGSSGGGGGGSMGGSSGSSSFGSGSGSSSSGTGSFIGNTNSFLSGSTTTNTTNNSTNGVGSTSFLGPNYASPIAQGLGSATSTSGTTTTTPAFGSALCNNLGTTTSSGSTSGGSRNGGGSRSGGSGSSSFGASGSGSRSFGSSTRSTMSSATQIPFASSAGTLRAPTYNAELAFPTSAPLAANEVRSNLEQVLVNSSRFTLPEKIRVEMANGVTVLRGSVATDRERSVAEAMIRLNAGVGELRNELVVSP